MNEDIWAEMHGTVNSIDIKSNKVHIKTDKGTWKWRPEGDCCTVAYIHEPKVAQEEAQDLIGDTIVSAECAMVDSMKSSGDVTDIHFYKIITTKSTLVITLYAEHNGYYGGWLRYEA